MKLYLIITSIAVSLSCRLAAKFDEIARRYAGFRANKICRKMVNVSLQIRYVAEFESRIEVFKSMKAADALSEVCCMIINR